MNPAAVFLILATTCQNNYDDHTFSLETNTSSFVLINDSGFFPSVQENYMVQNIGRSTIQAELWYGDELQWFGVVCGATIKPNETKILDNGQKLYYYTGLKVLNHNEERAIFHGDGGYLQTPYTPGDHFDMYKFLRKIFTSSVKYIHAKNGNVFEQLMLAFWPEKQTSLWNEILSQISPLLGGNLTAMIQESIKNHVNEFYYKFQNITTGNVLSQDFMTIASELLDLENDFVVNSSVVNMNQTNVYILPLYSNIVSMKIHFYTFGIQSKEVIGLSDDDVQKITEYASETYRNAVQHIKDVSQGVVDNAYDSSEAPGIFNNLMTIRTHLAIHGYEYVPIWKYKLYNPLNNKEIYNPVISYSIFFGKATGNLYAQSTPIDVPAPLNILANNKVKNQVIGMTVYSWCKNPSILKIGGIKLFFQNGEEYMMGTKTAIYQYVNLNGALILEIDVFGECKIDGLKFYLSNGDIKLFGQVNSSTFDSFKLHDHYISSFFLSSDDPALEGQAANIAVSYQWYVS